MRDEGANHAADSTLQHVLTDSGALLVLTLEEFRHRLPHGTQHMCLDDSIVNEAQEDSTRLVDESKPSDSAYIIYTSGVYIITFCSCEILFSP